MFFVLIYFLMFSWCNRLIINILSWFTLQEGYDLSLACSSYYFLPEHQTSQCVTSSFSSFKETSCACVLRISWAGPSATNIGLPVQMCDLKFVSYLASGKTAGKGTWDCTLFWFKLCELKNYIIYINKLHCFCLVYRAVRKQVTTVTNMRLSAQ